jgi:hypothetical protein
MAKIPMNSLQEDKSVQPERRISTMMVMPNQITPAIMVDSTSGDIKQIYHLGGGDDITITQRLANEISADSQQSKVKNITGYKEIQPGNTKIKNEINSLTVRIDQYNITIEGKKTLEELQKIAKSLIAIKIES